MDTETEVTNAKDNARKALVAELNAAVADHLALYGKTKSFHWHVAGPRFHDLHTLFDEQASAIFELTDVIAERVRKLDGSTITSIGSIAGSTAVKDQDSASLTADDMLAELRDDNVALVRRCRAIKKLAGDARRQRHRGSRR